MELNLVQESKNINEIRKTAKAFAKLFLKKGQLKLYCSGISAGEYLENLFNFYQLSISTYVNKNGIYNIKISQKDSIRSIISIDGDFQINIHNPDNLNQKKVLYNIRNKLKIQETFYVYGENSGVNYTCIVVWSETGFPERYIFDFTDFTIPSVYQKNRIPFVYVTEKGFNPKKGNKTKNLSKDEMQAVVNFLENNGKQINFNEIASKGLADLNIAQNYEKLFNFVHN